MKNLLKTFVSILFALSLTSPTEALERPLLELNEASEEEEASFTESGNGDFTIMFLRSDFDLSPDRRDISDHAGSLLMFMTNPKRKIVKDAQIVVTTVSQTGDQLMSRARPYKGGYFIKTDNLAPGRHRLEAEIITDGWLLTEQFYFEHS